MINTPLKTIKVTYQDRIDKYISANSDLSRTEVQRLIVNHAIFVNDISVRKANFIVTPEQEIIIHPIVQKPIKVLPEPLELDIIYEDDDIIVINKQSGVVVHPAPGNYTGTLVSGLLHKFKELSTINEELRPGVVHRIDKDTSGLLIFAKNNEVHKFLAKELKDHKIKRTYLAWVEGKIINKVIHVDLPIGRDIKMRYKMAVTNSNSKWAKTHIFVEKIFDNFTLVRCELETGRTHQIRVHLSHIGHPIVGDPVYGRKIDDFGQRLHAYKLEFVHPRTKKIMIFKASLPSEFNNLK